MSDAPQKILVAVAWPYASGPRHLGHVAGPGVPSDVFARYHRLKGNDVLMVSGTDEHGTPVMVSADREGVTPRELADRNNEFIREDLRNLGISYDCFTRTAISSRRRRSARSPPTGGRCPTATSRGRVPSAVTARRAATSATTAATS